MTVFAPGTKTLIVGSTAPPGWTKNTSDFNNHMLRVTNGVVSSGGSVDFSTVFAGNRVFSNTAPFSAFSTGTFTLGPTTLPAHTHTIQATNGPFTSLSNTAPGGARFTTNEITANTASTGAATVSGHSHPGGTLAVTSSGTIDLAIKYVDVIIVTKD